MKPFPHWPALLSLGVGAGLLGYVIGSEGFGNASGGLPLLLGLVLPLVALWAHAKHLAEVEWNRRYRQRYGEQPESLPTDRL